MYVICVALKPSLAKQTIMIEIYLKLSDNQWQFDIKENHGSLSYAKAAVLLHELLSDCIESIEINGTKPHLEVVEKARGE